MTKNGFKPADGKLTREIINTNITNKMRDSSGNPLYLVKENVTQIFGDFEKRKVDVFQTLLETFSKEQVSIQYHLPNSIIFFR